MPDVATLGIKVENGEVVKATASMNQLAVAGGKAEVAANRVSRRMGLAEIEARKMDAAMSAAGRSTLQLSSAQKAMAASLGTAAFALAAREVFGLAEAYTGLSNKLRQVTTDAENRAAVEAELFRVSQDTRTSLEGNVALYASLARSTKELGLSQQNLIAITGTVSAAMAVGGASASEQASAIRQLSQAFASGVLRGDEFNSMAENAPRLQQILATSLGVTIGELRKMAEEGQLTSSVLARAFLEGGATVRGEVEGMTLSISGAMTQIRNALLEYVGAADSANGASSGIAQALSEVADNIPRVLDLLGKMIKAMRLYYDITVAAAQATMRVFSSNPNAASGGLLKELEKAAGPGVSTKPGSGGGRVIASATEAARIAREAEAARRVAEREAQRQREQEERDAERAIRKQEDYADDLKEIWDDGMADIARSATQGFQAILESIGQLTGRMLERMAQEGQTNIRLGKIGIGVAGALAGYGVGQSQFSVNRSAAANYGRGAIGGAAAGAMSGAVMGQAIGPIGAAAGAAIGGLTGFIGGIFGVSNAAKEAKRNLEQMNQSLRVRLANAQGNTEEAQRLSNLMEIEEYRNRGADAYTLALLRQVQAQEAAKRAADGLTGSMLNLPTYFKYASAIFGATTPRAIPIAPGGTGGERPGTGTGEPINVTVYVGGEQVAATVKREFKREAQQKFGDTTLWGQT